MDAGHKALDVRRAQLILATPLLDRLVRAFAYVPGPRPHDEQPSFLVHALSLCMLFAPVG